MSGRSKSPLSRHTERMFTLEITPLEGEQVVRITAEQADADHLAPTIGLLQQQTELRLHAGLDPNGVRYSSLHESRGCFVCLTPIKTKEDHPPSDPSRSHWTGRDHHGGLSWCTSMSGEKHSFKTCGRCAYVATITDDIPPVRRVFTMTTRDRAAKALRNIVGSMANPGACPLIVSMSNARESSGATVARLLSR